MAKIDFDKPHYCPNCPDELMQVLMPIWVVPGEEIDPENIDYESGNPQDSNNWYCPNCGGNHFPKEFDYLNPLNEIKAILDRIKIGNLSERQAIELIESLLIRVAGESAETKKGVS